VAKHARTRLGFLIAVVLVTGFFSAFLVNDAICLALTPLVIEIVRSADLNHLPYLLGVAQRPRVRVPSSPPFLSKTYREPRNVGPSVWVQ
jgi:di/tricarboxylate transporter